MYVENETTHFTVDNWLFDEKVKLIIGVSISSYSKEKIAQNTTYLKIPSFRWEGRNTSKDSTEICELKETIYLYPSFFCEIIILPQIMNDFFIQNFLL